MATTEELKHKIATARDLQSVVKTMKALAAVSIRQYEKAVESLSEYNRTLEMGWQILLQHNSEILFKSLLQVRDGAYKLREKPTEADPLHRDTSLRNNLALVVFGSDWGMCGQFNERISEYTQQYIDKISEFNRNYLILNVGVKIGDRLSARGQTCTASFNLPSSVTGITPVIQEIVLTLENWRQQKQINQIVVIYNQIVMGATYYPCRLQILPINPKWLRQIQQRQWSSHCLPTFTMEKDKLISALFRQYFFVSLYRACAESLKSENTSRLGAMQMAEKNIAERLTQLSMEFNHQRQTMINEELLDIVAGFEASAVEEN